jgi:para-nitrobenzyl esterase
MFYIHGGAYANGSGSDALYDGTNLCLDGDVVVITINHRLNAFGYLYLAGLEREISGTDNFKYSGNVGQMDIIAALKWVKQNIGAFGGNPDNIMVFGQSGGGAKIASLMATPAADGLFNSAATMSGQQVTASGQANATTRAKALFNALGIKPDDAGLKAIINMPVNDITAALGATDPVIGKGVLYMGPVYDNAILFRHPFYPDAAPQARKIPVIIGNTHDETRYFLNGSKDLIGLDWEKLPKIIQPQYRIDIDPIEVVDKYREIYPQYSPEQVYFAATTAGRSWRAAIIEAEELAKVNAPAYVYQLDWQSPKDGGKWGACHTMDIPLVFKNTHITGALSGDSECARKLAKIMSQSFINFAKSGNPNCDLLPKWQKYNLPNRETMIFDLSPRMENDPRGQERELFTKVPFIQQGT